MNLKYLGYQLTDAFRTATLWTLLVGGLGGGAVYLYGVGDSAHGRKTIENMGAKVVADKGHPPFGAGGGAGIFSTRFTIETRDGKRDDVVVSHGFSAPTSITFKNR